jgi:hypothetical protein
MKGKKMKINRNRNKRMRRNKKNKKQKRLKNRLQIKGDSMKKELVQFLMNYLETLNLELYFQKKILKVPKDKNKTDTQKKYNF